MPKTAKVIQIKLHQYFNIDEFKKEIEDGTIIPKGHELYAMLPATPDWCNSCNGTGGRSKWDIDGLDIDMMIEDDEDSREAYFSGRTDVTCNVCNGTRVIFDIDRDNLTETQKNILIENDNAIAAEREMEAEREAERRVGA